MKFHEPASVGEAVKILARDRGARCLAGGATLVAMMNADLVRPTALISLRRVKGLAGIAKDATGGIAIGAMTRHVDVAGAKLLKGAHEVVREAAAVIGHPAIRNMGTMGGSISHADAAADYPAALVAADAVIEIAGAKGKRRVPASDFFVSYLETALKRGEMVTAVRLPKPHPGAVGVYEKFARTEGDFATISVALTLAMKDRAATHIAIAIGACAPKPVRLAAVEAKLNGSRLDDAALDVASKMLAEACDPVDDFRGSGEYRLMILPEIVRRAIARARAKLET